MITDIENGVVNTVITKTYQDFQEIVLKLTTI